MKPRVLIVGTVPYNEKSTSRAFASYFANWEKEKLAQIFSNTKTPVKGQCSTLFQITDQRILKRRFDKSIKTGKVFNYNELPDSWDSNDLEVGSNTVKKMYSVGSKKNSLIYLARKILWKKKYWCTPELNKWMDSFNPECIFLSFSDDFFITEIAIYAAKRYNIPIVSSIGDDYYFNYKFSLSPLYHIYKLSYRALIRSVFKDNKDAIYIGDKIRDKYNSEFGLNGRTVYLTSSIMRREFKKINTDSPIISYFGNIRMGRNESIYDIGIALGKINPKYKIQVYSNENDPKFYRIFDKSPNIEYCGTIPYTDVLDKTLKSDIVIVVEGFKKKDVNKSRYSLSTKVADSLASGVNVFAYGSLECGAIEYAMSVECITTCVSKSELEMKLKKLIYDTEYQKKLYQKSIVITNTNHRLENSTSVFEEVVNAAVNGGNKNA